MKKCELLYFQQIIVWTWVNTNTTQCATSRCTVCTWQSRNYTYVYRTNLTHFRPIILDPKFPTVNNGFHSLDSDVFTTKNWTKKLKTNETRLLLRTTHFSRRSRGKPSSLRMSLSERSNVSNWSCTQEYHKSTTQWLHSATAMHKYCTQVSE